MPTVRGSLAKLVLAPSLATVTFEKRGFPVTPSPQTARLELIPQSVICGFEWGLEATDQWEVERRMTMVDPEFRGFACEGVTMAFTVRDAMGRGHWTRDLLRGPSERHIFLSYIGIGFAMARLPRPLWKKVIPDLSGNLYYPTMSWLAVDGYGFDRAYFDTQHWVDEQKVPAVYPWLSCPDYFLRAVDQGIGRALWFIHGGRPAEVAAAVPRFASHRQADLWSGVGLAATFAGGCDGEGLTALRRSAADHAPELGLGMVFAAKARDYAGFVPAHTEVAASALADLSVSAAVTLADDTAVTGSPGADVPGYELWRRNIRNHLTQTARTH